MKYNILLLFENKACNQNCPNKNQMIKFKRYKVIEISSDFKNKSLILELRANNMICVSNCQLDSSCSIVELSSNNFCQLHNETALQYLIAKDEKKNEFIYFKEKYV